MTDITVRGFPFFRKCRDRQDGMAVRSQRIVYPPEYGSIVLDVFENLTGDDDIEPILVRKQMRVAQHHCHSRVTCKTCPAMLNALFSHIHGYAIRSWKPVQQALRNISLPWAYFQE
jgi:hypothetical protein